MSDGDPQSGTVRRSLVGLKKTVLAHARHRRVEAELRRLEHSTGDQRTWLLGPTIETGPGRAWVSQYRSIFQQGVLDFVPPGPAPRIVDCGANVGMATLCWKRHWPQARVLAVEADAALAQLASRNLAAVGIDDVEMMVAVVGDHEGLAHFVTTGSDDGHVVAEATSRTVKVEAVRLGSLLDRPTDLLKVDIEGAETDALIDAAASLDRVENVFVEYHSFRDRPQRLGELVDLLVDAGFRLQLRHENASTRPFMTPSLHPDMDMQVLLFGRRSREWP